MARLLTQPGPRSGSAEDGPAVQHHHAPERRWTRSFPRARWRPPAPLPNLPHQPGGEVSAVAVVRAAGGGPLAEFPEQPVVAGPFCVWLDPIGLEQQLLPAGQFHSVLHVATAGSARRSATPRSPRSTWPDHRPLYDQRVSCAGVTVADDPVVEPSGIFWTWAGAPSMPSSRCSWSPVRGVEAPGRGWPLRGGDPVLCHPGKRAVGDQHGIVRRTEPFRRWRSPRRSDRRPPAAKAAL